MSLAALVALVAHPALRASGQGPGFATKRGAGPPAVMMQPPSASPAEAEHRQRVDEALRLFWRGREGYNIKCAEELAIDRLADPTLEALEPIGPSTYGEVTPLGVRQIGRVMCMDAASAEEPVVFMDLGSGVGKFVAQAFLEWPAVSAAIGVELSPTRSARAVEAWESLMIDDDADALRRELLSSAPANASVAAVAAKDAVRFLEGDMFEVDVSRATHVYVASLCFTEPLLARLAQKLAAEAPRLRGVATLKPFPQGLPGFELARRFRAEMSWTLQSGKGALACLYERCRPEK